MIVKHLHRARLRENFRGVLRMSGVEARGLVAHPRSMMAEWRHMPQDWGSMVKLGSANSPGEDEEMTDGDVTPRGETETLEKRGLEGELAKGIPPSKSQKTSIRDWFRSRIQDG